MQDAAAPADTGKEPQVIALPFTHQPRAANFAAGPHVWQRRFGASEWESVRGVRSCDGSESTAIVYRSAHQRHTELRIDICFDYFGSTSTVKLNLDAAGLRELARCLVDAAHDLDTVPATPREVNEAAQ